MKCPLCKKTYSNIITHLTNHGYTQDEAERMIERVQEADN